MSRRFWGKYPGKVILNTDTTGEGRVQISCPTVLGSNVLAWARPCVPMAGLQAGVYAIPPINANVWVEFQGGDPELPIWSGCFWGPGELPLAATQTQQPLGPIVIQAPNTQYRVVIGGSPTDGIRLETIAGPAGPMVKVDSTGITMQDGAGGMITIKAGTVMVNMGALMIK